VKLELHSKYRSIKSLKPVDLPNFTILTGVNGSGKTQLLEAISKNFISIDGIFDSGLIRLFDWNNLVPNDSTPVSFSQLNQQKYAQYPRVSEQFQLHHKYIVDQLHQFLNSKDLIPILGDNALEILSMSKDDLSQKISDQHLASETIDWIQDAMTNYEKTLVSNLGDVFPQAKSMVDSWKRTTNKSIVQLREDGIYEFYDLMKVNVGIFQQSFSQLFLMYEKALIDNDFSEFLNTQKGKNTNFVSAEQFVENYGEPPWKVLNSILEKANLDFRITEPANIHDDRPYQAKLIHVKTKDELGFSDLSSGEKILMSITFCLYPVESKLHTVIYPKLLLFDEIDAPLHPSMTQSLLNVIQDTLVRDHRIKVIMTTHSPSTVALAPENSLYVMEKDGYERIKKISKDAALAILTTGVPTLSIDYENRRQVFVESGYDAGYYEEIYKLCRHQLEPAISLTFIASGHGGQGNCDQVEHIVTEMKKAGNKTAYGIIDWDTKNEGNERVKVLGKDKRYSIENYILDPILLSLLMWKDGKLNGADFGFSTSATYKSLQIDNLKLQSMVDFVIAKFIQKYPTTEAKRQPCNYISNHSVEIPVWYLVHHGHELEEKLKKVFPFLKQYQREDALKMAVLERVLVDYPDLLSADFIELFKEIQNYPGHS
jgi:energy-coupling factor transporter ATP-binding protein EcfA2